MPVEPLLVGRIEYKIYAAITAVLVLKMLATGFLTTIARARSGSWANPEDTRLLGGRVDRDDRVERVRRLHLNSLENEPLFMVIGLLYVIAGAPVVGIQAYGYTFLIGRILHAAFYLLKIGPLRSASFAVSTLALVGMSIQVLLVAFR